MKRNAFTLVEMMVVMSIIALLVVIVMPSMSAVSSMARATICRNNLQKLGSAFAIANTTGITGAGTSGAKSAVGAVYPKPMIWPAVPRSAVDDPTLYHCPEDPNKGQPDVGSMFKHLQYENEHGLFTLDTLDGAQGLYKSQSGQDPVKGGWTDYLLEDDNDHQYVEMAFHGWIDSDGVIRVWHSTGELFVYKTIPDTPEWHYTGSPQGPGYRDSPNTCQNMNNIRWMGQPAWSPDGAMNHGVAGSTMKLPGWDPGYTNYGISSEAYNYPYGSRAIVLLDYKQLWVDLDVPKDAETNLCDSHSARHLGRLNILYGDGTVGTQAPLAISPRLYPKAWQP
jgi:prepilin-type N-terminal cleavage/methylation domain-containing protein/prepilin-type processing-associated H-X9-DG protein